MSRTTLQISAGQAGPTLTPQQKRFNTLIRKIAEARRTLAQWQDNIGLYRQAHSRALLPLENELAALRRQWVFALDEVLGQRGWTKAERETLRELVCEYAGLLLNAQGDDEELKAVFDRHAEVDFDTEQKQIVLTLKDLAQSQMGLDLGDDEGIDTHADLLQRLQQGMRERAAAEEAEGGAQPALRRKSAAQQRREAEAQQATQSVREIFRKLASALHPDRETDAAQREAKTGLMQKVNQAYAANDLLTLLELQLQIEQIDAGHIANASAQRLKHYNKVLAEQLEELEAEIERVEMGFRLDFGLEPGWGLKPGKLVGLLDEHERELRAELDQQQYDMSALQDKTALKRWLKQERQRRLLYEEAFDFDGF